MDKQVFITKSAKQTQQIAKKFALQLHPSDVIALFGNLGSGKTTFVQGIAKGLGITKKVISPTFVIVRMYNLKLKAQSSKLKSVTQSVKLFYHVDLYRLESEKELQGLGIEEVLQDKNNIVVIEWAEKMEKLLPKKRWDIYFEYVNENARSIQIIKNT